MTQRHYDEKIAARLSLRPQQVAAAIKLLDEGNTVPFIARYRKEMTGGLDEFRLREVGQTLQTLRTVDERRETVLNTIAEQGKLTPELEEQIVTAETLTELEDLYQPYKPKRRTRASIARERGLEPLAELILQQPTGRDAPTPKEAATSFLSEDVPTIEDALAGARDIVAETISDHPDVRGQLRQQALRWGLLTSQKLPDAEDPKATYELYYAFEYRIDRLRPYQILALNRGEAEKVLRVKIDIPERDWRMAIEDVFRPHHRSPFAEQMALAISDAARRLLLPAIERDVRRQLTEEAEARAIEVFAHNLHGLLNQPPLAGHVVLGIDPGYRTGCKVAVVDETGKVLATETIYPHPPQRRHNDALKTLVSLIDRYGVTLIAIGNGTASRETEQLAAEITRAMPDVHYIIVNEAGASVYSASELAAKELPGMDVTLRGAVSIARRVQDPLAELVKIDPKSIGVGMYQHDVNQKALGEALDAVVETVVNRVGVDVNTASVSLLTYVAGIGPKLAQNIVAHRDENGPFPNRRALKKVAGLGPKAFEQAAGFLRIRDGNEPLDATAIHPESYDLAHAVLDLDEPLEQLREPARLHQLAEALNAGVPTLADIIEQLLRPGRDPREDLPAPILRSDVLNMEDLMPGMQLNGTVRNVVDFGAFVDIGVKQDGLLHISKIPQEVMLHVGDVITVEILSVDIERGRIGLGWI